MKTFIAFKLSDVVVIMLINVQNVISCWHFNIYEHDNFYEKIRQ